MTAQRTNSRPLNPPASDTILSINRVQREDKSTERHHKVLSLVIPLTESLKSTLFKMPCRAAKPKISTNSPTIEDPKDSLVAHQI
jgi:hypothetical protein